MANFIELTANKSGQSALVNVDAIAWISAKEVTGGPTATIIHFRAAHAADALSLMVKENYTAVIKKISPVRAL